LSTFSDMAVPGTTLTTAGDVVWTCVYGLFVLKERKPSEHYGITDHPCAGATLPVFRAADTTVLPLLLTGYKGRLIVASLIRCVCEQNNSRSH